MKRFALVLIIGMLAVTAIPMDVWASDISNANFNPPNTLDVLVRPKLKMLKCELAAQSSNTNGTTPTNMTGSQIDVLTEYTFAVKVRDVDNIQPNSSFIHNVTLIAAVGFEGDPSEFHPNDYRADYNKRNYEFQLNATRTSGGGSLMSIYNMRKVFPGPSNDEMIMVLANSSWVGESDDLGSDGVNDTIEFRWAFKLGANSRNTNSSGAFQADDWHFYAVATDIYEISSDTRAWDHTFDVFQYTDIWGGGHVVGRDVPGGNAFLLDQGPDPNNWMHFSANNNATFYANATDFSVTWSASTLSVSRVPRAVGDGGWVALGADDTKFESRPHPNNGARSFFGPGPGEAESVEAWWKCSGVPPGTPSGPYNSNLKFTVEIAGT